MTSRAEGVRQGAPAVLVLLLVISIFINYIDRSNLSVAAPLIQSQLGYSTTEVGLLSSAFFWTYAALQIVGFSGWMSDHFNAGKVLAAGFLLWSVATVGTGLVHTFAAFFTMRLLLGVGESFAYPCYSRLIATAVPQYMRGRANAFLDAGSKLGPGVGTFLGGLLLDRYSWRLFFVILGLVGMLWLIPWMMASPMKRPSALPLPDLARYGTIDLLRKRSAWAAFLGHFCGNYFWFFLLLWLPSYFVKERGMSIFAMAKVTTVAYLLVASGTLLAGWVSDLALARGQTVTAVRKSAVVIGLTGSVSVLPVAFVSSSVAGLALLYIGCFFFGIYTSNHWAITQTLAGPFMAGRWTGIQNGVGNLSGIVAAWLTGVIADRQGSFRLAFAVAGAIALLGALSWGLFLGPVREINWEQKYECNS